MRSWTVPNLGHLLVVVVPVAALLVSAARADQPAVTTWSSLRAASFQLQDDNRWMASRAIVADLQTKAGLPCVALDEMNFNRTGTRHGVNDRAEVASVDGYHTGFTWESGDQSVTYWYPQGITGTADAHENGMTAGGRKLLLVSWYYKERGEDDNDSPDEDPPDDRYDRDACDDNDDKGVRLSVVDVTSMDAITYRHVLLVEPFAHADGTPDFCSVPIHAGGMAWYKNLLYVVDTDRGVRVFGLSEMMEVSTGNKSAIGLQDGKYHAFDYRYVVPQVGMYALAASSKEAQFSWVALDRSTSPHSLLTGEYCADSDDEDCDGSALGRVFRWELDESTGRLRGSGGLVTAAQAYASKRTKVQGGISYNGRYWLARSNGGDPGKLVRCTGAKAGSWDWAIGPEDLHYSRLSDNLWTLTEHPGKRCVFAVKLLGRYDP